MRWKFAFVVREDVGEYFLAVASSFVVVVEKNGSGVRRVEPLLVLVEDEVLLVEVLLADVFVVVVVDVVDDVAVVVDDIDVDVDDVTVFALRITLVLPIGIDRVPIRNRYLLRRRFPWSSNRHRHRLRSRIQRTTLRHRRCCCCYCCSHHHICIRFRKL